MVYPVFLPDNGNEKTLRAQAQVTSARAILSELTFSAKTHTTQTF